MLLSLYCHLYNPTPDVRNEANPSPCPLPTVFLELPVAVVQRAHLSCLEPSRDAVEVEGVLRVLAMVFVLPSCSKRTLQMPQATVHSSLVADAWLAWHSMHRSMMWFRQMAQLSTTMSHAHSATAFHCTVLAASLLSRRVCPPS
jgi:hypothetical protein